MISVVGGGPAGSIAAKTCAKEDDVILFEEHEKNIQPAQCAGLISISGLKRIGVSPAGDFMQNKVRGVHLHSPSGKVVEIDAGRDIACVVDRNKFDEYLLNSAADSGVKILREKVCGIKELNENYPAEKIILATGTRYALSRKLNLPVPEILSGIQYETEVECDPGFVELYFNVPGFFSWIIPTGEFARVGLCTYRNPKMHLDNFIKNLKQEGRIKNSAKILNRNGGIIPVYNPQIRTEYTINKTKILLVGDAAAHVKATTGGGIVMGGLAAQCVSRDYEKQWRQKIGKELYLHMLIRNFMNRLSGREIDSLVFLAGEYKDVIQKKGDMDIASGLTLSLMKHPKFPIKIMGMFIRSLF